MWPLTHFCRSAASWFRPVTFWRLMWYEDWERFVTMLIFWWTVFQAFKWFPFYWPQSDFYEVNLTQTRSLCFCLHSRLIDEHIPLLWIYIFFRGSHSKEIGPKPARNPTSLLQLSDDIKIRFTFSTASFKGIVQYLSLVQIVSMIAEVFWSQHCLFFNMELCCLLFFQLFKAGPSVNFCIHYRFSHLVLSV